MSEQLPPVVADPIIIPKVYEPVTALIPRVIGEMRAVGRDQWNEQQKFKFRGIDDMKAALKPAIAKHGVFWVPLVLERHESERKTSGGKPMYVVHLRVRLRFYGPAGDYVDAEGWGEGTDMGDKATNKAMTGAEKYIIGQVFCIADAEGDADRGAPPDTAAGAGAPTDMDLPAGFANLGEARTAHYAAFQRARALADEIDRGPLEKFKEEHGWPMARHDLDQFEAMLSEAEAVHETVVDPTRPFDEPTVQEPTSPEDTPSSPVPKQEPEPPPPHDQEPGSLCRYEWETEGECLDVRNGDAHECEWQVFHVGGDHKCSCGEVIVGVGV